MMKRCFTHLHVIIQGWIQKAKEFPMTTLVMSNAQLLMQRSHRQRFCCHCGVFMVEGKRMSFRSKGSCSATTSRVTCGWTCKLGHMHLLERHGWVSCCSIAAQQKSTRKPVDAFEFYGRVRQKNLSGRELRRNCTDLYVIETNHALFRHDKH
jgi:RNase P subunit RPR2